MKYHIHIPKLEDFALYSSCDNVTKHGTAGLARSMNRPLYYRCIMTYAAKKCNILTVYQAYKQLRTGSLTQINSEMTLVCSMMLLDHVDLTDTIDIEEMQGVLKCLVNKSDVDANAAVECIHRFAGRCIALGKHSLLATILSGAFGYHSCKQIRDIVLEYGGKLEIEDLNEESLEEACRWGLCIDIQRIVDSGIDLDAMKMQLAVESGDLDAIRYVATQLGDDRKLSPGDDDERHVMLVQNLTPSTCEILLTLGVFVRDLKYGIANVISVPVVQWFIDHDMIDLENSAPNVAIKAVNTGGPYVDVLHYLIEQLHVKLPKNLLTLYTVNMASDLGILDYLISCGVVVDQAVAVRSPLLLRYWMNHGLVIDDVEDFCWRAAQAQFQRSGISDDMFFSVMSEILHFDVNTVYKGQMTLLHHVCVSDTALAPKNNGRQYRDDGRADYAKALLKHGAKVNVTNATGQTPLHQACCIRTGQYDKNSRILLVTMLLDNGAVVNVIDKRLNTPLHLACEQGFIDVVQLLLEHGAIVNARNSQSKTSCDMTSNEAVRNCLCDYGYMPK